MSFFNVYNQQTEKSFLLSSCEKNTDTALSPNKISTCEENTDKEITTASLEEDYKEDCYVLGYN